MSHPLWQHQVDGIRLGVANDDFMLAFEQGTGKTRTLIEILRRRYADKGALMKTLIFAPIIVCDNWKKEFALYSKIKPEDILVLTQSGKRRTQELIKACGDDLRHARIVVTNYQATLMPDFYMHLRDWCPEIIVCDESQRVKNHEAKTSKLVASICDLAKHRYLLTGTPILNSPADIFMQYRIMDGGITFGKNFYTFRAKYFVDMNDAFKGKAHYFPKWVPRYNTMSELNDRIKNKSLRVLAKDCIDLPELIVQDIPVTLSRQQEKMYEEMKQDFLTFLKDKEGNMNAVVAELAVTKAMRMQQIVSGFVKDDSGNIHHLDDVPRLSVLEELLDDLTPNHKVIVWAVYHENYKAIAKLCDKIGVKYVELHGGVDNKQRIEAMDNFRNDDSIRVAIANQRAAGIGVNLIEARYAIYYSKGYSLEDQLQSETRNFRGGSSKLHSSVCRINLVAQGTIDQVINDALTNKLKVSQAIIDNKEKL